MREEIAGYEVYEWSSESFQKYFDQIILISRDKINQVTCDGEKNFYLLPEEFYKSVVDLVQRKNRENISCYKKIIGYEEKHKRPLKNFD